MNQARKERPFTIASLILPGFIIYFFVVLFPILFSLFLSLFNFSTVARMRFIGIGNYRKLVADREFYNALANNLVIIAGSVVGQLGIGYAFALAFAGRTLKRGSGLQALIFFPAALSPIVIGFVWKIIYGRYQGLLNAFLGLFLPREGLPRWLEDPDIALGSVLAPIVWQEVGFYMVIFIAGIKAIPAEILESAEIDGAGTRARIRHIIIPMTQSAIKTALILCIAGSMRVFDQVYIMTGGGPGRSTMVLALLTYNTSFTYMRLGYGNAMSVGISVLGIAFVLFSQTLLKKINGGEA